MSTWIFHRGALGDSLLLWPALRSLGPRATLASDASKARLAARFLRIHPQDIEQPRFSALWSDTAPSAPIRGVDRVVSLLFASPADDAGRWRERVRALFPGAGVELVYAPLDRLTALSLPSLPPTDPGPIDNHAGPVVLHVGAGSREKQWPLVRWATLAHALPRPPVVLAGEVERDRFSAADRGCFSALSGRFIESLDELADLLLTARMVVAADSGPGHLAAQLGLPTLSLFGPTDPARWAPIGPRARYLAPPRPSPMTWLEPSQVLDALA